MERALQYSDNVWRNLNPLKAPPKMKHKSYFEAVENADKKKKKLEFEITTNREPPPGFEFIPTGHPELSQECKEQSRDRDAMFFIVSNSKDTLKLDHHMNRLGYHFRHSIAEEARKVLTKRGHHDQAAYVHEPGKPEPIPNSQREIDLEADAVLRDLFPRIPHTDRQEIIDHAFKKDGTFNGEIKVGMAKDITLARRVQLAALAHIRHTHTRYDQLLKESDWANARKAVEKPCLDLIVKWRGDEETGRDQLDEILREVIEISDTEFESEDEGSSADNAHIHTPQIRSVAVSIPSRAVSRLSRLPNRHVGVDSQTSSPALEVLAHPLGSPGGARALQGASQRAHYDAQQVTEVPRFISRTLVEPAVPSSHPRSPGAMVTDQGAAKRSRVTTYFPEDFQGPPNSHVRVASRSQHDVPRPQFEYLADRQPLASRGPERVVYQDIPWTPLGQEVRVIRHEDGPYRSRGHPIPVTGDDRSLMGSRAPDRGVYQRVPARQEYPVNRVEAPLRSRANPIVIDGDNRYEPRRVIEVRGSPAHEIYRTASPRGNGIHSPHIQGDPRIRGPPRVVYVDESAGRLRNEPGNRHMVPLFQLGPPTYEGTPRLLSPGKLLEPTNRSEPHWLGLALHLEESKRPYKRRLDPKDLEGHNKTQISRLRNKLRHHNNLGIISFTEGLDQTMLGQPP
ncbi:hypothetical protein E0Z10_g1950 [Xylaria hypoxylon]|uniref:DUF2293 domain-containing protein n=1 Tax=Xylaria hypoxylon TaxID=37992 RepID=A0A4Z0YS70_9PEZI|nr:hypothetical protein E0Z10_g1950 [Xylaria hypoxylon]